jgi:hypothetical protein
MTDYADFCMSSMGIIADVMEKYLDTLEDEAQL